jgi:hypothetical protein
MINPFRKLQEERERSHKARQMLENKREGQAGQAMFGRTAKIHGKNAVDVSTKKKHYDYEIK